MLMASQTQVLIYMCTDGKIPIEFVLIINSQFTTTEVCIVISLYYIICLLIL